MVDILKTTLLQIFEFDLPEGRSNKFVLAECSVVFHWTSIKLKSDRNHSGIRANVI